jgi:hypothetical protein
MVVDEDEVGHESACVVEERGAGPGGGVVS